MRDAVLERLRLLHVLRERRETADDRRELRDGVIRLDEIRQRILHAAERADRLHEAAERHLAAEITRRREHKRHDDRELCIAIDVEIQELRLAHELPVV